MNTPGKDDGPGDVDATFAEIVADLRAEGLGSSATTPESSTDQGSATHEHPRSADRPATGWRGTESGWEQTLFDSDASNDEHFVPPDPPPLPRPRKGAFIVLFFFVLGLSLLIVPNLLGLTPTVATPLGILTLTTAVALLLLRVKQGPPDGADPDNGAQV